MKRTLWAAAIDATTFRFRHPSAALGFKRLATETIMTPIAAAPRASANQPNRSDGRTMQWLMETNANVERRGTASL
jgi:hypothetical protein